MAYFEWILSLCTTSPHGSIQHLGSCARWASLRTVALSCLAVGPNSMGETRRICLLWDCGFSRASFSAAFAWLLSGECYVLYFFPSISCRRPFLWVNCKTRHACSPVYIQTRQTDAQILALKILVGRILRTVGPFPSAERNRDELDHYVECFERFTQHTPPPGLEFSLRVRLKRANRPNSYL